ncbi:MAG: hypothetical protein HZC14_03705 [Candidatus Niyogibacteria bacterium]|nr:hypothetical protein [Candidatus Niyogibacteria bacterium]
MKANWKRILGVSLIIALFTALILLSDIILGGSGPTSIVVLVGVSVIAAFVMYGGLCLAYE